MKTLKRHSLSCYIAVLASSVAVSGSLQAQQTITYSNGQTAATPITIIAGTNPTTLTIPSGTATQSGIISELGTAGKIIKAGAGAVTLSGSNTFTGGVSLDGGTLSLNNISAIGTAGPIIFNGGTLQYTMASTNPDYSSRFNIGPNVAYSFSGGTNVPIVPTSSNLGGPGSSLTAAGSGRLSLTGSNDFSGGINLKGGFVLAGNLNALGSSGTISFGGGILGFAGPTDYSSRFSTAPGQQYWVQATTAPITLASDLNSAGGSFTVSAGMVTVTGHESLSGSLLVLGNGNMIFAHGSTLSGTPALTVGWPTVTGTSILQLGDTNGSTDITVSSLTGYTNFNHAIVGGSSTAISTLTINNTTADSVVTSLGGTSGTTASKNLALTKTGAGTLTLTGTIPYTYIGRTTVTQGELDLNRSVQGITGAGAKDLSNPDVLINGGTLKWLADDQIDDTATVSMTSGTLNLNGKDETFQGFQNSGGTFTTGASGGLNLGENSTLIWSGGTNTITPGSGVTCSHCILTGGTNTVQSGFPAVLTVTSQSIERGLLEMTGSNLTLNSDSLIGGQLGLSASDVTIHASSTTSTISNSGSGKAAGRIALFNPAAFTVEKGTTSSGIDLAISAQIINTSLTKEGPGTLQLSGSNTFSGATTINEGVLQIDGPTSQPTMTVKGGRLQGTSLLGDVVLKSGGTLMAGTGSTINTTFSVGALSAEAGSKFAVKINSSIPTCDRVNAKALTLNNTNLVLSDMAPASTSLSQGTIFTILTYTSTGVIGTGTNLFYYNGVAMPQNSTFVFGANSYQINYTSGGSAITLTALAGANKTYDQWAAQFSVQGGASGIPFNDGVSNLLKYLFDIDPTHFISSQDELALPMSGVDSTTTPGTKYLTLTYRRAAYQTGLQIEVQTSTDLQTWQTVTPNISTFLATDPTTGDATVQVEVDSGGVPRKFIRLKVSQTGG